LILSLHEGPLVTMTTCKYYLDSTDTPPEYRQRYFFILLESIALETHNAITDPLQMRHRGITKCGSQFSFLLLQHEWSFAWETIVIANNILNGRHSRQRAHFQHNDLLDDHDIVTFQAYNFYNPHCEHTVILHVSFGNAL
jgi:hypothetical protein